MTQAEYKQMWERSRELIKNNLEEKHYRTWFEPLSFYSYNSQSQELKINAPSNFFNEYISTHFLKLTYAALRNQFGMGVRLFFRQLTDSENHLTQVVETAKTGPEHEGNKQPDTANTEQRGGQPEPAQLDSHLISEYCFDNFIEGTSNILLRSVGLSIVNNPKQMTFNPLFIYGHSGVGKTHLVNAIGVRIREMHPEKRVLFVSAHVFKTQYTDSVIHNTQNDFINFYQTIDVLIIDDIQEITTAKTQQSFFHIFNHLQQNNRQIIITCDRPPVLLAGMEERMLTRFKWGMTAELEKPDTKLRRDILISKIRRDGLVIPAEVVQYIAAHVESSVRELEGIINSIMAYSVVDNCEIDLELTQRVVARAVNLERKELSADDIAATVGQRYGVKPKEMASKSRKQTIVQARQLAMYLIHKYTDMTYSGLGRMFGKRDHSTVLYACNQVAHRIGVEKNFRREVEEIEATLK